MKQMAREIIEEDYFSVEEEAEIRKVLDMKKKKGRVNKNTFAATVDEELNKYKEVWDEEQYQFYQEVFYKCFNRGEAGEMSIYKISTAKILAFMRMTVEELQLSNKEIYSFVWMLRAGIRKLHKEGILQSVPEESVFRKYFCSKNIPIQINNPYTAEEIEKIIRYAELHPVDSKALAVGLWLSGNIALSQIVELKSSDCWGTEEDNCEKDNSLKKLFSDERRTKIAKMAFNAHPYIMDYIFVEQRADGKGWDKLRERGVHKKFSCICREIGIPYKVININEIIRV